MLSYFKTGAVVVASAALLSACNGANSPKPTPRPSPPPTPVVSPMSDDVSSISGTINELVSRGKPLRCTWETTAEGNDSSGTLYTANNQFRVDATLSSDQDSNDPQIHVIGTQETVYQWAEGSDEGIQVTPAALESAQTELQETLGEDDQRRALLDLMDRTKYSCEAWEVDEAQFEVPENVTFTDISGLLRGLDLTN